MKRRFRASLCAAALLAGLALCAPLGAQSASPPETRPADTPHTQRPDRPHNLDFLFDALKVAPDDASAKAIKDRIWTLWLSSGGDTTDLLMTRVKTAMDAKDFDLAVKLLDAIVDFKPDYVEGWDRRATVYYLKKEYGHALADIAQVLAREPRHFGALFGLGMIMQEFGDDKRALDVYRRALAIDPHSQRIPELVKTLTEKIEGRDIYPSRRNENAARRNPRGRRA
jgi:tetratricopeptide (TPR) repeat protein